MRAPLLAFLLILAACGPAGSLHSSEDPVSGPYGDVTRFPRSYFRLRAVYEMKETGERFAANYVVACSGRIAMYPGGTPSYDISVAPQVYVMATPDGGALSILTPEVCAESRRRTAPDNYMPWLVRYEDVNDLSFGWGHMTERAYKSPLSPFDFVEASLASATQEEWLSWREQAAAAYVQQGAVPGPWGFQLSTTDFLRIRTYGNGKGVTLGCSGYKRTPVPADLMEAAFEKAPAHVGRWWLNQLTSVFLPGHAKKDAENQLFSEALDSILDDWYRRFGRYHTADTRLPRNSDGTLREAGGGYLTYYNGDPEDRRYRIGEVYPLLPKSRFFDEPILEPRESYPQRLLIGPEWDGFAACGGKEPVDTRWWPAGSEVPQSSHDDCGGDAYSPVYPHTPNKPREHNELARFECTPGFMRRHPLYVNDEMIAENVAMNSIISTGLILDRSGYLMHFVQ